MAKFSAGGLSLGQEKMALSIPVAIASDQASIPVTFTGSKTPADAYVTPTDALDSLSFNMVYSAADGDFDMVREGTDAGSILVNCLTAANFLCTASLAAGTNVIGHVIVDSGTITTVSTLTTITNSVAVTGTFWQATQPVSGTVTADGDETPTDTFATPTDALVSFSLGGLYDGADWEMARSHTVSVGGNRAATGIASVGLCLSDGAAIQNMRTANNIGDGSDMATDIGVATMIWNGTKFDRARTASGDALAATGLLGTGLMSYNVADADWDRVIQGAKQGSILCNSDTAANFLVTATLAASSTVIADGDETPGDAFANPTDALSAMAFGMVWNVTDSDWDRVISGAKQGSILVNSDTAANFLCTTTPPTDATTNVTKWNGTAVTLNKGASDAGTLRVALGDGTQVIGHVIVDSGTITTVSTVTAVTTVTTLTGITNNVNVIGTVTPADTFANPSTALTANSLGSVYSSTDSDWDRMVSASGDSLAATLGIAAAGMLVYSTADSDWDRARAADGDALGAIGLLASGTMLYHLSDADWDRAAQGQFQGSQLASPLPSNATDLTKSATGAAAAHTTATLTAGSGPLAYIVGFDVTTLAGSAAIGGLVTVTGPAVGTLSYQYQQETGAGATLSVRFPYPLKASAVSTDIVVDVAAMTGGGAVAITAFGFKI